MEISVLFQTNAYGLLFLKINSYSPTGVDLVQQNDNAGKMQARIKVWVFWADSHTKKIRSK